MWVTYEGVEQDNKRSRIRGGDEGMRTEFWWTNHLRDQDGVTLFRSVRKFSKSNHQIRYVCLSVRPSVRMEKLGFHWTDFH
jgi:hypothetical protein